MLMINSSFHERLALYCMLLSKPMAKLPKYFLKIMKLDFKPEEKRPALFIDYRNSIQLELAEIIRLIKNICFSLNISYPETEKMGEEIDKRKKEEFIEKYPNEPWV